MLKIEEIKKGKIPTEVWNTLYPQFDKDKLIACYKSEGMFGAEFDYLLILKEIYRKNYEEYDCHGYVYNGNHPECSEFGGFGLNKQKSERIW